MRKIIWENVNFFMLLDLFDVPLNLSSHCKCDQELAAGPIGMRILELIHQRL